MTELDRVNILVVDDQPAKLLGYEAVLGELGETLVKAESAREALDHLLKKDIAVILIDVCMPELSGFELASLIRDHPRFENTPIIFVSAIALADIDRLKGYKYGAVDYVPVPVVPEVLRAKVRFFTEMHRKTRQLEALNLELERRVAERTADLERANADLEQRVEERTHEREAALSQLHEMQKLESLGKITGGLAHDFNNLLNAIIGNLEPLARRVKSRPQLARYVMGAIEAAERGANLTARLLAFARRQDLRPESVNVEQLVAGMKELLQRSVGPTIEISTDFLSDLAAVRVDPNQLELVLLNLAVNARDAMEGGGSLVIAARNTVGGPEFSANLAHGQYVCLAVTDTGTGMDEATARRATEPFFTTKELGKGTGLGLAMVHGMAGQSGGAMRIRSRLGHGTTVELWLPVDRRTPDELQRPAAEAALPSRSCHILLVDDDPMVAKGSMAMLSDLGHTVTIAESGRHALQLLQADVEPDLVITDHAMPGMTGIELANRISALKPKLPVVLATGYAELPQGAATGMPRLDKPYRARKVTAMIDSVLGQAAPARSGAVRSTRRRTDRKGVSARRRSEAGTGGALADQSDL